MPTYEYRCRDCGQELEIQQAFTDDALTECPACQGRLRKVFGNVGISFKGSGFYKNDHGARSKSSANGSGSSNGDTSSSNDSSSSSNDTSSSSSSTSGDSSGGSSSSSSSTSSDSKSGSAA